MNTIADYFGSMTFDDRVMKATLSADIYASLKKTIDEGANLNTQVATAVLSMMLEQAMLLEDPSIRNSNLFPVKAKGEVRFRSVVSRRKRGSTCTPNFMTVRWVPL